MNDGSGVPAKRALCTLLDCAYNLILGGIVDITLELELNLQR